jgi:hypothetical protein
MDTLSTNMKEIPPPKWKFWTKEWISLSRRSATRYLFLLMSLLCLSVFLGFLVSTATNLSSEIQKLIDSCNQSVEKIISESDKLQTAIVETNFSEAGPENMAAITGIQKERHELNYKIHQMFEKAKFMSRLVSFNMKVFTYEAGGYVDASNIKEVHETVNNYYICRQSVVSYLLQESIIISVIAAILPIFLGFMGACAYVVRLISDQIKDTTFSTTSPIRHLVRVLLGGLAGVVIGFGGVIANPGSLSPSALAFIAGYAVEPVFATVDSIAEKFRRG